jgi:hypothetical protein
MYRIEHCQHQQTYQAQSPNRFTYKSYPLKDKIASDTLNGLSKLHEGPKDSEKSGGDAENFDSDNAKRLSDFDDTDSDVTTRLSGSDDEPPTKKTHLDRICERWRNELARHEDAVRQVVRNHAPGPDHCCCVRFQDERHIDRANCCAT